MRSLISGTLVTFTMLLLAVPAAGQSAFSRTAFPLESFVKNEPGRNGSGRVTRAVRVENHYYDDKEELLLGTVLVLAVVSAFCLESSRGSAPLERRESSRVEVAPLISRDARGIALSISF